jgi:hypothetical protein
MKLELERAMLVKKELIRARLSMKKQERMIEVLKKRAGAHETDQERG